MRRRVVTGLLAGLVPALAHAQAAPPAAQAAGTATPAPPSREPAAEPAEDEIVVTGERQPGEVVGDIPPEKSLSQAEIRSYGVSSIADLLSELSPETTSGRGRGGEQPVALLNGRRISSFAEIRDIPTEAILRVDILPEEVALKYGYRADQKVVNFVLRQRFRAFTGELNGRLATEGGTSTPAANGDLLHIRGDNRLNLDLRYSRTSPLFENERSITPATGGLPYAAGGNVTAPAFGAEIDPALSALAGEPVTVAGIPASGRSLADFAARANDPNVTDLGRYRTLTAGSDDLTGNAVLHHDFGQVGATVNARVEATGGRSELGLPQSTLLVPAGGGSPFGDTVAVDRYLTDAGPLVQRSHDLNGHLGFTIDRQVQDWRLSLTGNYDRAESHQRTDRGLDLSGVQALLDSGAPGFDPFGPIPADLIGPTLRDRARSTSNIGGVDLLASGPTLKLPAGRLFTSLRLGGQVDDFDSRSIRSDVEASAHVNRGIVNGQLNVDLPLASRRLGFLPWLGELSINGNVALDHLSDFGTLKTIGYGVHWAPVKAADIIVSTTDERGAPTPQQLGNPLVLTPNVRVFDYVRGETVDVTAITGGNPDLSADHRHVFKASITLRPLGATDFSIVANYTHQRINNAIASFPTPTVAIEAAFPERFTRNADGVLTEVDDRPVNFARDVSSQLRWGFNLSLPLVSRQQKQFEAWRKAHPGGGWRRSGGTSARGQAGQGNEPGTPDAVPPPPPDGGGAPPPPPGARDGGGFGGGPRAGGPGGGGWGGRGGGRWGGGPAQNFGGRLQFGIYHTWFFRDDVLIRPGVPVLDLLDGAATGARGGQPQHQVEVQAGILQNGFGARLSATWQSATTVTGETAADDLRFHPFLTTSVRLFADLGQQFSLVRKHPWMRGMRVTFAVDNLLNRRLRVTDPAGTTPVSYQPDYLDPLGRTVRISIRKLFFSFPQRPR